MLGKYPLVINKEFDHIVIGAGIVGISLGLAILERNPNKKVLIIDKEPEPRVESKSGLDWKANCQRLQGQKYGRTWCVLGTW